MPRLICILPILVAVTALCGCNETSGSLATAPVASAPVSAADFKMPEGSGCGGELARYQAVLKADVDTGNVNKSVYDQIQSELARASAACSAGRDGEAIKLIRESKARHGYRA